MKKRIVIKRQSSRLEELYSQKKDLEAKIKLERDRCKNKDLRFKLAEVDIKILNLQQKV